MDSTLIYHYVTQFELIPKIGKFSIIFDTRPCEIDDLAVSSRQYPPHLSENEGLRLNDHIRIDRMIVSVPCHLCNEINKK